jgi:hypothetical protein
MDLGNKIGQYLSASALTVLTGATVLGTGLLFNGSFHNKRQIEKNNVDVSYAKGLIGFTRYIRNETTQKLIRGYGIGPLEFCVKTYTDLNMDNKCDTVECDAPSQTTSSTNIDEYVNDSLKANRTRYSFN